VQRPLVHTIEGPLRVAAWRTLAPVDLMPEPGDLITAWYVEACRRHAPKLTSDQSEGF